MFLLTLLVILVIVLVLRLQFLLMSRRTLTAFSHLLRNIDSDVPSPCPSLSVLIPARNEQTNIGECVESILQNDYPILEIIVIDDGSTDRTGDIVEEMQQNHGILQLVRIRELRPGWSGKNHALYSGVQKSRGDYLLFIDADVRLGPGCITRTMNCALGYDSDLLTMYPSVKCAGFWEKVILPVIHEFYVFSWHLVRRAMKKGVGTNTTPSAAFGGYMLFKRATYDAIGGHESVRSSIPEDTALARIVQREGYNFTLLLGLPEFITARMYFNFRHIWEGWNKTITGARLRALILSSCLIPLIFILPWLSIPISLGAQWLYGPDWLNVSVLILGVCVSVLALFIRRFLAEAANIDNTYPYLEPLGALVFVAMVVNSIIRTTLQKGVHWKGRTYPT